MDDLFEEPLAELAQPVSKRDLLNNKADLTVPAPDDDEKETNIEDVFGFEKVKPFYLSDNLEGSDSCSSPFTLLREKMLKITDDGKVRKLVMTAGLDDTEPIGDKLGVVSIHYASYVEYGDQSFDVSELRQSTPIRVQLGKGQIILGLEIAIRSMKVQEKSKFLIDPDLAYGKLGVPPRIPSDSTILCVVTLYQYQENAVISDEPPKPVSFAEHLKKADDLRISGNTLRKTNHRVEESVRKYREALFLLQKVRLASDDEELSCKVMMDKLYTNLSICYNDLNQPKKACTMYNEAILRCRDISKNNARLLYNSAKALRELKNYDEAIRRLRMAIAIEPNTKCLSKELALVRELKQKDLIFQKESCRRMFGFKETTDNKQGDINIDELMNHVDDDLKKLFREKMTEFMVSEESKMTLSVCPSMAEREFIRREAGRRLLYYHGRVDFQFSSRLENTTRLTSSITSLESTISKFKNKE